jgi:hypothetical protein
MKPVIPAIAMPRGQDLAILHPRSIDTRKKAPSNMKRSPPKK